MVLVQGLSSLEGVWVEDWRSTFCSMHDTSQTVLVFDFRLNRR